VERHFPGHEVSTAYEAGCCGKVRTAVLSPMAGGVWW